MQGFNSLITRPLSSMEYNFDCLVIGKKNLIKSIFSCCDYQHVVGLRKKRRKKRKKKKEEKRRKDCALTSNSALISLSLMINKFHYNDLYNSLQYSINELYIKEFFIEDLFQNELDWWLDNFKSSTWCNNKSLNKFILIYETFRLKYRPKSNKATQDGDQLFLLEVDE